MHERTRRRGWRAVAFAAATMAACTAIASGAGEAIDASRPALRDGSPRMPLVAASDAAPAFSTGPAATAGDVRFAPIVPATGRQRFYRDHLLPRLNRRLDGLETLDPTAVIGLQAPGEAAFRELTAVARRGTFRATKRALRDFVLESTGLEARGEVLLSRGARRTDPERVARADSGTRVRFGISSLLPRVTIERDLGDRASIRMSLRAAGAVGVEFERRGAVRNRLFAGYVHDDRRCDVQWRIAF